MASTAEQTTQSLQDHTVLVTMRRWSKVNVIVKIGRLKALASVILVTIPKKIAHFLLGSAFADLEQAQQPLKECSADTTVLCLYRNFHSL